MPTDAANGPGRPLGIENVTIVTRKSLQELESLELVLAASVKTLVFNGCHTAPIEDLGTAVKQMKCARLFLAEALRLLEKVTP